MSAAAQRAGRSPIAWILVISPPRERPMAWQAPLFVRPGAMLMGADDLPHTPHDVSIHAPMKGATALAEAVDDKLVVSIHAPVKGATRPECCGSVRAPCFDPPSREGSDPISVNGCSTYEKHLVRANRPNCAREGSRLFHRDRNIMSFQFVEPIANLPAFSVALWVRASLPLSMQGDRMKRPPHMMSGPLRSATGLAPTCSTRRCQLAPR